jgi:NTE family protein
MTSFACLQPDRWLRQEGEMCATSGLPFADSTVPRIGLALSSGGARGLAHVGVIQVLEENDIPIAAIAGTSMGAYVGSLWAAGLHSRRLEELAAEIKDRKTLFKLLDFQFPPSRGLIRGERIRAHLERDLGGLTFAELRSPALLVATDLDSLDAHVFDSGLVATAVHASAAIPAVCVPVNLDGRRYTDGGASEPLPVSLLRQHFALDHVIAVNVMPRPADFETLRDGTFRRWKKAPATRLQQFLRRLLRSINLMDEGNVIDTFHRALMSAQLRLIQKECATADVVIQPRFERSTWHDFENFDHYIRAGREAALAALK